MKSLHRQKGFTMLGWFFAVALIVFLVLFFIRIAPVYYDYVVLRSIVEDIAADSRENPMSRAQLTDEFFKLLNINSINYIERKHLKLTRKNKGMSVELDYEVRTPFIGNLGLVVDFGYTSREQ